MPPSQTSCQVPAGVKKASGEMLIGNMNAFGPEANFSYPLKPAGGAAWNIDWTAKVRFRSHTMLMVGADFGDMSGANTAGSNPTDPAKKTNCKGPVAIPLPTGARLTSGAAATSHAARRRRATGRGCGTQ